MADTYEIQSPYGVLEAQFDHQPTAAEAQNVIRLYSDRMAAQAQAKAEEPTTTWGMTKNVAIGAAKNLATHAIDLAGLPLHSSTVRALTDWAAGEPAPGQPTTTQQFANKLQAAQNWVGAPTNRTQQVGATAETGAEIAAPIAAGARYIGSLRAAAPLFDEVLAAARGTAVPSIADSANATLRAIELDERGATAPPVVKKYFDWITNPNKPQMTYEVMKDFAGNFSKVSAKEYSEMNAQMARQVATIAAATSKEAGQAAAAAGKGAEYAQAMNMYARAMKIKRLYDGFVEGMKIPAGVVAAEKVGGAVMDQLKQIIGF